MADEIPDELPASKLPALIAGLIRGQVALLAWEEIDGVGTDLDAWELEVETVSSRAGVQACFVRLEKARMTVTYNKACPPTEEYIHTMVALRVAERAAAAVTGEDEPPAGLAPS